eukprot:8541381-Pyramimonas_sp.AAC.1
MMRAMMRWRTRLRRARAPTTRSPIPMRPMTMISTAPMTSWVRGTVRMGRVAIPTMAMITAAATQRRATPRARRKIRIRTRAR